MEQKESVKTLNTKWFIQKLQQFKYPALVLALGSLLLLWPKQDRQTEPDVTPELQLRTESAQSITPHEQLQQQLGQLLSNVAGAGKVEVMLTLQSGERTVYQSDTDQSGADGDAGSQSSRTVVVSTENGGQSGLAVQIIGAEYRGAVVISEGADSAQVRLNLVNAVADLTGLSADQITVIKMKS